MKIAPANNNNDMSSMTSTNMAPNAVCGENTDCNNGVTTNNDSTMVVNETQQLVTFHDDLNPVSHSFDQPLPLLKSILSTGSDGNEYSLKSFLERPRRLVSTPWVSTDAANATIYTVAMPIGILGNAMYAQKFKGFMGFRATTIFRIQINTTRFQQGRLMCNFLPLGPQAKYDACPYLVYKSQWPRVEFDVSVDTEVILEVPFIHTVAFYNLLTGDGNQGYFQLNVYSPLVDVVGSAMVVVNIITEFKDIELVYPAAPTTLFPQAIDIPKNNKNRRVKAGSRARQPMKSISPSDAEADAAGVAPVSSFLSSLSTTASFAANIPLLSSVAAPVSWASALLAKAAHAFGYSNPINNAPAKSVIIKPTFTAINSSGVDNSYNLGLFEDNKIETLPGFAGTNIDEMALSYPLSIPTYFTTKTWSINDVVGTRLDLFFVGPQNFFSPNTTATISGVGGRPVYHYPPVNYFSRAFEKYRGSIRLTFKVVKTEFHTGRLLLAWNPVTADNFTYTTADYCHKEIIDLRLSTEFTITCPFGNPRQYLTCDTPYGYLAMFVQNPLIAPPNVSPSVSIICEVSCADDFEFAQPCIMRHMPVFPGFVRPAAFAREPGEFDPPLGEAPSDPKSDGGFDSPIDPGELPFEPQAGDIVGGSTQASVHLPATDKPVGSSNLSDISIAASSYCIGERITSLRQLLKRSVSFYNLIYVPTLDQTTRIVIDPWSAYVANSVAASGSYGFQPDYFSFFGSLYAMFRGSIRIKRIANMGRQTNLYGAVTVYTSGGYLSTDSLSTSVSSIVPGDYFNMPIVPISNEYQKFEVQIPYYNLTFASQTVASAPGTFRARGFNDVPNTLLAMSLVNNVTGCAISLARQIGEDFDFGFFTGTVPLTDVTVGSTNSSILFNTH
jgi:hypothetical protein